MFREIFLTEIYPRYFEHLKHPDVDPDVYFIGGQPGSGKSVRERVLYNATVQALLLKSMAMIFVLFIQTIIGYSPKMTQPQHLR